VPDPDWELSTLDGEILSLRSFRGTPVFVNLWATWCPPCVEEMASIQRLVEQLGPDSPVRFALVTPEEAAPVQAFLDRNGLALPVYLEGTLVPESMDVEALPTTVILDGDGRVVLHYRGAAAWDRPEMVEYLRTLSGTP
jgi:thiol-disulfide isomerase/thioredoxin